MLQIDPKDDIIDYIPISNEGMIINNTQKFNMNEHLKSFIITFVVAFAMVFVADIDKLTLATLNEGALFGLIFAGVRAGVKAILQFVITKYSS